MNWIWTCSVSKVLAFFQRGGLCDPMPVRNAFEFEVQKDRIRPLDLSYPMIRWEH